MLTSNQEFNYCLQILKVFNYWAVYLVFKYYLNTENFTVFIKVFKYCQFTEHASHCKMQHSATVQLILESCLEKNSLHLNSKFKAYRIVV